MTGTTTLERQKTKGQTIEGLHHFAYRCRDAEETRAFYEDVLGLKLGIFLRLPHYEQPGDIAPFCHLFFEMGDGSYVAFFDLGDNDITNPDPDTPAWVNHLALRVDSLDTLQEKKARLEAAGVKVKGPKNHHFVHSIYFEDPNGIHLELTTRVTGDDFYVHEAEEAHARLKAWTEEKRANRTAK